jgi:hypothetical protein
MPLTPSAAALPCSGSIRRTAMTSPPSLRPRRRGRGRAEALERRDRVGAVEDAIAAHPLGAHARFEGGDVLAPDALAPAHRADRAGVEPALRRQAHLRARHLANDGEDAAHRLERAQRLLELAGEDQRCARRVVRERRAQAVAVPARRLDDAQAEEGDHERHRQADRKAARRPLGARHADQREDDRRRDEHAGEVAEPPGRPRRGDVRRRDDAARAQGDRRHGRADDRARGAAGEEGGDVARQGQGQRLADEAAHEGRPRGGLQHCRQGDHERDGVDERIGEAARRDDDCVRGDGRHADADEHARAEHEHARQRDTGRGVER